ncbi:aldehyde dehydrogenase family protein [Aquibacillus sp. 3ASR75-11]|uniref:Aldehyde dehydrogenase family protein n=1 Tax=Terrihalobacillus insolitus TaxID=2950438 RepID=A0A9X3WXZ8_9BACI|nr:aldehyde dehydrogenase family protein [Terrihalobacillus insolitus]MDC3425444.1 aldehyde dehydrogenase family protein [Terrihalobacillus insolitus]
MVTQNWINSAWEKGNGKSIAVKNPSDLSETVGEITFSTSDQAKAAEVSARNAFKEWKSLTGNERGQYLYKMAQALENHAEELAELASREMGKPIGEMKGEVVRGIQLLNYYAAEGVRSDGDVIPSTTKGVLQYTKRIPLGVVALITPWNFPVAIPIWKLAPALICGNTIVWKPAENGSLTAFKLCNIVEEAGVPKGVINLVIGQGKEVGAYLTEEANMDAVSFTGSTATGTKLAGICAQRNIKYQTEMGGKNAAVVLNDADLQTALPPIVSGTFRSAGQKCTASSRIIVEEGIFDEFIDALKQEMKNVQLKHALNADAYLGPVASKEQFEKVTSYVELAKNEAEVIYEKEDDPGYDGYYINPIAVTGVTSDHPLFQEEVFGPLTVVIKVKDYDEAVNVLNKSSYGLSGSIFTNNLNKAHQFMEDAEIGMVRVNLETAGVEYQAPFGGLKQSSSHTREQGQAALSFYSNIKTCAIKY